MLVCVLFGIIYKIIDIYCFVLQDFVAALLEKVRGMQKLNTPQKKGDITP